MPTKYHTLHNLAPEFFYALEILVNLEKYPLDASTVTTLSCTVCVPEASQKHTRCCLHASKPLESEIVLWDIVSGSWQSIYQIWSTTYSLLVVFTKASHNALVVFNLARQVHNNKVSVIGDAISGAPLMMMRRPSWIQAKTA